MSLCLIERVRCLAEHCTVVSCSCCTNHRSFVVFLVTFLYLLEQHATELIRASRVRLLEQLGDHVLWRDHLNLARRSRHFSYGLWWSSANWVARCASLAEIHIVEVWMDVNYAFSRCRIYWWSKELNHWLTSFIICCPLLWPVRKVALTCLSW